MKKVGMKMECAFINAEKEKGMKGKKPQKQLLQTAMLSLLSAVMMLAFASPSLAALDCDACHGGGVSSGEYRPVDSTYRNISTGGFVGSHRNASHLGNGAGVNACVQCHNSAGYTSSHRNGQIQMHSQQGYTKGTFFNQTSVPTLGSCATASCHGNPYVVAGTITTPTWGTTGVGCAACHKDAGALTGTGGTPVTGTHDQHMAFTSNYNSATGALCTACHSNPGGAGHNNSNIDVTGVGYPGTVPRHTAGSGYQGCASASCHVSATGTANVVATWGAATGCATCHAAVPVSGDHSKHLALTSLGGNNCGSCHAGADTANGGTSHGNTFVDVRGTLVGTTYPATAKHATTVYAGSCSTACHNAYSPTSAIATTTWNSPSNCTACHSATPTTGDHNTHLATLVGANCGTCHTGATAGVTGGGSHGDGNIDVAVGYTANNAAKHAAGTYAGTCSTACHNTYSTTTAFATPIWGAASNCANCHSATPTTGDHNTHLAAPVSASCGTCHTGATAGVTGGAGHGNGTINVAVGYTANNAAKHAAGTYTGTCSTNCHNAYSTTTTLATPIWGAASNCANCHAATPTTGDHSTHLATLVGANCGTCHTGATAGVTGGASHGDTNIDVAVGYTANNAAKHAAGTYTGTCSTTCHNTYSATTAFATPIWGAPSNCANCHAATPTTGDHNTHLSAQVGANCGTCHTGATAGVTGGAGHGNAAVNVAVGYTANNAAKHAAGTYTGTCSTTCHNTYSATTAFATPIWGAPSNCANCHAATPTTGDHSKHIAAVTLGGNNCGTCHTGATAGVTGGASHGDANIDVAVGYTANNAAKHAAGTYAGTCSTACHNAYSTTTGRTTPIWGSTSITCTSCHDAAATTGSHIAHNTTTMTANVSCNDCHTGASVTAGGAKHFDGFVNISANHRGKLSIAKHTTASTVNCSTSYCHGGGDPNNVNPTLQVPLPAGAIAKSSPTWGVPFSGCNTCHGAPPVNTDHASGTGYVAATSCNGCHDHVTTNGTGFNDLATTKKHINGVIDGGKCDACHGFPPVQTLGTMGHLNNYTSARLQNYSGGGGVHAVAGHLALTVKQSDGFGSVGNAVPGCATCHPSANTAVTHNQGGGVFQTANVQVVIDPQFRFDKTRPIVYNAKQSGTLKNSGTCANVSCHFQKSPIWSTETYTKTH